MLLHTTRRCVELGMPLQSRRHTVMRGTPSAMGTLTRTQESNNNKSWISRLNYCAEGALCKLSELPTSSLLCVYFVKPWYDVCHCM